MPCYCADGWICEKHPDRPWPTMTVRSSGPVSRCRDTPGGFAPSSRSPMPGFHRPRSHISAGPDGADPGVVARRGSGYGGLVRHPTAAVDPRFPLGGGKPAAESARLYR